MLKLKEGFILRTVAGETVVLPTNGVTNLDMMITLNDTGKFIWETLVEGAEIEDIVAALSSEYEVDTETAKNSVEKFIARLKELEFLV